MANFSFVSGAKFRPFSYSEMLQPLQAYTNEYNTIQESIGELGTKASVFDKMANEQSEPQAYAMYKQYSKDLAEQAESLAKQGLTPSSRQGLIDMKKRYSSDIIPIEQAYKRRQDWIDEERKMRAQDSTLLFDRPASSISLDELLSNPALSPQSYSGALLSKQVSTAAQNLAKDVRDNPDKWKPILQGQYYESVRNRGFRPEEVMQAIENSPKASPILRGIVEDAIKSSGIQGWNDTNALNRAYDYARQGLWSAVGDTQYQQVSNKAYDYDMKAQLAAMKAKKEEESNPVYKSVPVTKAKSVSENLRKDLDFIRQVYEGKIDLNAKSTRPKKINDPLALQGTRGYLQSQYGGVEEYYPNQERTLELSKRYGTKDFKSIVNKINSDMSKAAMREQTYILNITDPSLVSKSLVENAADIARRTDGNTGIYELEDNKKGDVVKLSDIKKYFDKDFYIGYDPKVGLIASGTDSKGNTKNFLLDPETVTGEAIQDEYDNKYRNKYQAVMDDINRSIEAGDELNQRVQIDRLMKDIYSRFNTISKKQSDTDSKI